MFSATNQKLPITKTTLDCTTNKSSVAGYSLIWHRWQ